MRENFACCANSTPLVAQSALGDAMSDIFKGYEEEYCALSASIGQKTAKVEGLGEAERRPVMKEVEAELTQASELLEQMALEVRSLPAAERSRLNTTLKGYKADLAASRGALREAEATATRVDLLGGGAGAELPTEERSRLLAVNERLQEGARTLRNAERTVLETEAIGASILGDLRTQRETIEHASGTLRGANDNLARSKRLIQGIARRALANKLLMWLMIVVLGLLVALLLLVELGVFGGGGGAPAAPDPLDAIVEAEGMPPTDAKKGKHGRLLLFG